MINDGIWDDGEWISWDTINCEIHRHSLRQLYPYADFMLIQIFEDMIEVAEQYYEITGRYLPIFGELGEILAEITFDIKRHKPRAQGSDGRLDNDFIEIKTITPEKCVPKVSVNRKGHYNKLLVIKIDENFNFEARMLHRKDMPKGNGGKQASVSWNSMKEANKSLK